MLRLLFAWLCSSLNEAAGFVSLRQQDGAGPTRVKRHILFGQLGRDPEGYFRKQSQSSSKILQRQQQEQAKYQALVRAALNLEGKDLISIQLVGAAELPTSNYNDNRLCLALSEVGGGVREYDNNDDSSRGQACVLAPLLRDGHIRPIEAAFEGEPLPNLSLLRMNLIAVNRDEGLWDNLPWPLWTVDPARRSYDAAGNPILPKFHLGKRDAYNVMLGKDWFTYQTSSRGVELLAQQLQKFLFTGRTTDSDDENDEDNEVTLAQRLLDLQMREMEMDIADLEYQIAVAQRSSDEGTGPSLGMLEFQKEQLLSGLDVMKSQLEELLLAQEEQEEAGFEGAVNSISDLVQRILDRINPFPHQSPAPYRGATGYAPYSAEESQVPQSSTSSPEQFCSPFDMLVDIIENQLNAEVIGCVLENTSLLEGTITLGGAVVLRRQTAQKQVSVLGESLAVDDEREDYGNQGVQGGETFVVECEVDEAVGLSLASGQALQLESTLWQQCSIMAESTKEATRASKRQFDKLPTWQPVDPELSILVEGQARNQSTTERVVPIRIPRTTNLYDSIMQQQQQQQQQQQSEGGRRQRTPMFPTDNPIQSLEQLDNLTDQDKARTLLSMSNFQGRLPRPRVVRQLQQSNQQNPLDDLLIPLVDESVRRQYKIRDARLSGDLDLVRELEASKSQRQRALEAAELARAVGQDAAAEKWEKEAKLYESLRADVTQDEGSYSRFLDRDEWYERERRQHASKLDKKKFGTLLDGIE